MSEPGTSSEPPATSSATPSASPKLTLHYLENSQALRTWWALEELADAGKLVYDVKQYPRGMKGPPDELFKLTTTGTSPVLTVEYPDGKVVNKIESRLIIQWLHRTYGDGIWSPESEEDRERDEFWTEFATASLAGRVNFLMIFEIIPAKTPWILRPLMLLAYSPVAAIFREALPRFFKPLEDALQEKEWFAGDKMGISDIMTSWPMDVAIQRGYVDKKQWPKIHAWYEKYTSRESYKRAVGRAGKYNMKTFD